MSSLQLFATMQAGSPINMNAISRCKGISNLPSRIVGVSVESGSQNIKCWNVACVEVDSGVKFNAFVKCEG